MSINDEDCRRLMSLIAHELRSPGAVVSGYLRLLAKNTAPGLSEPERKMIDEANKSTGRLMHIAQELSDLAELTSGDAMKGGQPVPIFTLCGEVVQAAAESGGDVSFSVGDSDKDACIEGHAARLRQALGLLVSVMGRERGGGPLAITGGVARNGAAQAVLLFGDPSTSDLSASLEGHHAFDRWRGGTGLSLPIAHRIVEAHRGTIHGVASGPRGGCVVSLPLCGISSGQRAEG